MSATALPTEVQVIEETLKWFRRRDHFTDMHYLATDRGTQTDVADEKLTSTCAVGGIEHTIWRLTHQDVTAHRRQLALTPDPKTRSRDQVVQLYQRVMKRLNRKARDLFADEEWGCDNAVETFEQVTFLGDEDEAYQDMRRVLRAALRDARKEAA